jgi:hypothetical protein
MLISRLLRGTGDWESNEADSETFNAYLDYHYYLQFSYDHDMDLAIDIGLFRRPSF